MSDDPLGVAQMHLSQAITRSSAGEVFATTEHLETAADALETAGRDEQARAVAAVRDGDVCDSTARYELRQVAQRLIGERSSTAAFERASDGGERL